MTTDIKDQLRTLGLRHTADTLDDVIALATKSRWGAQQLFEHVARIEAEDRARRGLERRLGRSKLGRFKIMADFDWAWPKCGFRPMPITGSGASRSPIPEQGDHRFRSKPIAERMSL